VKEIRRTELTVGIFTIIAVLIVMFLIIQMGERVFLKEYEVTTYFENAAGLRPGVTVTLAGVPIGTVKSVRLLTPEEVGKLGRKGTLVRVVLEIEHKYGIPADSELILARTAILGEQTLTFSDTETMVFLPKDGSAVVWNTRLPPSPTEEVSAMFQDLKEDFGELIRNINLLLADEDFRENIKDTAANIAVVTDKAQFLVDDARSAAQSMEQLMCSAQSAVDYFDDSIRERKGLIGTLVNDEEFNARFKGLVKVLGRSAGVLQDAILRVAAAADEIRRAGDFFRRHPSSVVWGKPGAAALPYTPPPVGER